MTLVLDSIAAVALGVVAGKGLDLVFNSPALINVIVGFFVCEAVFLFLRASPKPPGDA